MLQVTSQSPTHIPTIVLHLRLENRTCGLYSYLGFSIKMSTNWPAQHEEWQGNHLNLYKQGCCTEKKTLVHGRSFSVMEKKSSKAGIRCWNVPLWPWGYKAFKWFTDMRASSELTDLAGQPWRGLSVLPACSYVSPPREWPQTSRCAYISCLSFGQEWKYSL